MTHIQHKSIEYLFSQRIPIIIPDRSYERDLFKIKYPRHFTRMETLDQFWRSSGDILDHLEQKHAVVASMDHLERIRRRNCSRPFEIFGTGEFEIFGLVMKKDQALLGSINECFLSYTSKGEISRIVKEHEETECPPKTGLQADLDLVMGVLIMALTMVLTVLAAFPLQYLMKNGWLFKKRIPWGITRLDAVTPTDHGRK